jgi:ParB family chromosome partitioning protein
LKELGAKSILALVIPDTSAAYQILAMNIEKAHNLREKSLEVARMYRELTGLQAAKKESELSLEFEEPQLVTLGFGYQARPRLSGGAYQSALKKVDSFLNMPLDRAIAERERRAKLVLELDDAVSAAVQKLKDRGLTSPYLKSFVVARVNPLRFIKGDLPSFDELLSTMTRRALGMKAEKIKAEDLSRSGGVPDEE